MSYLNKLKITFSVVGVVMPCCGCLETSCLLLRSGFPLCVRLWASASVFITEASSPHRWHHVSCLQAKDSDDDEEVVQVDRDHFMDEFFEQVRQRAQVTAGSHVNTGLNHELDTVRVVNSSWEHWDCSVWDKRLLRGRCLHRNKDTKVSWGRRDRKHRNKNVLAAMERAQDSGCTPSARWKISAKADKEVMMCKITLTFKAHRRTKSARA